LLENEEKAAHRANGGDLLNNPAHRTSNKIADQSQDKIDWPRRRDQTPNCIRVAAHLSVSADGEACSMNAHVKPLSVSPLAVADPKIRKLLQLAGLRFVCTRARWLESEATRIGLALKAGTMTSDEADAELERRTNGRAP
jgi:hypothetical protein